jgi:large subunit ribosomal protein L25
MTLALTAATRTVFGRQVRAFRRTGKLPLVVYGRAKPARSLETELKQFRRLFDEAGTTSLLDLSIDGGSPLNVLIHDVQHDPVSGLPIHADLYEVDMTKTVTAQVPLIFTNEAPAVRELDGTLLINQDTVEVECLPKDLPKELTVDLSSLQTFDDTLTAGSILLPNGVTLLTDSTIDLAFVREQRAEEAEAVPVSAEEAEKAAIEGIEQSAAEQAAAKAEQTAESEDNDAK